MPKPREHGSRRGAWAHRKHKERLCVPCAVAEAAWMQQWRLRGRCAAGLGWPLEARRG